MIIYLIRHGEKDGNNFDSNLTSNGEAQIKKLAHTLEPEKIKKIYASFHPRSIQTAKIISESVGAPIEQINISEFEKYIFFTDENNWSQDQAKQIREIDVLIRKIVKEEEDVLLAFHAGVNRAILSNVLDIPLKKTIHFSQDVACLNILEYKEIYGEKMWCIRLLNSTTH